MKRKDWILHINIIPERIPHMHVILRLSRFRRSKEDLKITNFLLRSLLSFGHLSVHHQREASSVHSSRSIIPCGFNTHVHGKVSLGIEAVRGIQSHHMPVRCSVQVFQYFNQKLVRKGFIKKLTRYAG